MEDTKTDVEYDAWIRKVDQCVYAIAGVSVHDLPDWPSRDAFDCGDTPREGARHALGDAAFYDDD